MTTTQKRGSGPAVTAKRAIALLLAMVMVLCLLSAAAIAASGHTLRVKAAAPTAMETTQGAMLEVPMTDIFDASDCGQQPAGRYALRRYQIHDRGKSVFCRG